MLWLFTQIRVNFVDSTSSLHFSLLTSRYFWLQASETMSWTVNETWVSNGVTWIDEQQKTHVGGTYWEWVNIYWKIIYALAMNISTPVMMCRWCWFFSRFWPSEYFLFLVLVEVFLLLSTRLQGYRDIVSSLQGGLTWLLIDHASSAKILRLQLRPSDILYMGEGKRIAELGLAVKWA